MTMRGIVCPWAHRKKAQKGETFERRLYILNWKSTSIVEIQKKCRERKSQQHSQLKKKGESRKGVKKDARGPDHLNLACATEDGGRKFWHKRKPVGGGDLSTHPNLPLPCRSEGRGDEGKS